VHGAVAVTRGLSQSNADAILFDGSAQQRPKKDRNLAKLGVGLGGRGVAFARDAAVGVSFCSSFPRRVCGANANDQELREDIHDIFD
jgi:hypothetical protein